MRPTYKARSGYSRRQVLKGLSLGLFVGFIANTIPGRLLNPRMRRRREPPVFPEGSIFTAVRPRSDR